LRLNEFPWRSYSIESLSFGIIIINNSYTTTPLKDVPINIEMLSIYHSYIKHIAIIYQAYQNHTNKSDAIMIAYQVYIMKISSIYRSYVRDVRIIYQSIN